MDKRNLAIAFLLGCLLAGNGIAQQAWDNIVSIARGSFVANSDVTVSNSASTLVLSASAKRPDGTLRNNSAYTIYIGTNCAGTTLTSTGFPVLTNEVVNLDSFSDNVYAISGGAGSADVRVWEGKIR